MVPDTVDVSKEKYKNAVHAVKQRVKRRKGIAAVMRSKTI